jgi:hypothetical protein
MKYQVSISIIVGCISILIGMILNGKSFTKSSEDKLIMVLIVCGVLLRLVINDIIITKFISFSFSGLFIGMFIKSLQKRRKK